MAGKTSSHRDPPGPNEVRLTGLSEAQEKACRAALQAFLERNGLVSWGLSLNLSDDGPQAQRLDISVVAASPDDDFEVRSSSVTVHEGVDLAEAVDLCLETHYNACMNRRALSHRKTPIEIAY